MIWTPFSLSLNSPRRDKAYYKPTVLFTSTVNPEAFKSEKGDTASLPIFTATMSGFLLGAEVTAVAFNTRNVTILISQSVQAVFLL